MQNKRNVTSRRKYLATYCEILVWYLLYVLYRKCLVHLFKCKRAFVVAGSLWPPDLNCCYLCVLDMCLCQVTYRYGGLRVNIPFLGAFRSSESFPLWRELEHWICCMVWYLAPTFRNRTSWSLEANCCCFRSPNTSCFWILCVCVSYVLLVV